MWESLPPGPRAPAFVQIAQWIARPIEFLEGCRKRYGDVFTLRAPGAEKAFVIVGVPELIKEVFAAEPDHLLAGVGNATLLEPMLGKHSLLTLDGAEHLRQRRLLLPAFHGERMQAFAQVMRAITERAIDAWPMDRPFALHATMQAITLDVILQTVFGLSADEPHRALRENLVELVDIATNPWLLFSGAFKVDPFKIPWLRVTKLKQALDAALYQMIRERRARGGGGSDVLAMMLQARDEAGEAMSDVELRDQLVTLLLAGHETTATSLAWVFDQLLANPPVLDKLRAELAAGRDEYLDAVIRETLRVRPIIPLVGRHVARPFQLGQWTIPVGLRIAPSIYLAGRRADAYPEPERFLPERWLGETERSPVAGEAARPDPGDGPSEARARRTTMADGRAVRPDPYSWLPFGGGVRRCIGMAFAMFEMRVVLQTIVPRVRMRLAGAPAKVVRRGIALAPSGGTRVVLVERLAGRADRAA